MPERSVARERHINQAITNANTQTAEVRQRLDVLEYRFNFAVIFIVIFALCRAYDRWLNKKPAAPMKDATGPHGFLSS
jgi:hypothetical protein